MKSLQDGDKLVKTGKPLDEHLLEKYFNTSIGQNLGEYYIWDWNRDHKGEFFFTLLDMIQDKNKDDIAIMDYYSGKDMASYLGKHHNEAFYACLCWCPGVDPKLLRKLMDLHYGQVSTFDGNTKEAKIYQLYQLYLREAGLCEEMPELTAREQALVKISQEHDTFYMRLVTCSTSPEEFKRLCDETNFIERIIKEIIELALGRIVFPFFRNYMEENLSSRTPFVVIPSISRYEECSPLIHDLMIGEKLRLFSQSYAQRVKKGDISSLIPEEDIAVPISRLDQKPSKRRISFGKRKNNEEERMRILSESCHRKISKKYQTTTITAVEDKAMEISETNDEENKYHENIPEDQNHHHHHHTHKKSSIKNLASLITEALPKIKLGFVDVQKKLVKLNFAIENFGTVDKLIRLASGSSDAYENFYLKKWSDFYSGESYSELVALLRDEKVDTEKIIEYTSEKSNMEKLGSYNNEAFIRSLVSIPGVDPALIKILIRDHVRGRNFKHTFKSPVDEKIYLMYMNHITLSEVCLNSVKIYTDAEVQITNHSPECKAMFESFLKCNSPLEEFIGLCKAIEVENDFMDCILCAMLKRIVFDIFANLIREAIKEINELGMIKYITLRPEQLSPLTHDVIYGEKILIFLFTQMNDTFTGRAIDIVTELKVKDSVYTFENRSDSVEKVDVSSEPPTSYELERLTVNSEHPTISSEHPTVTSETATLCELELATVNCEAGYESEDYIDVLDCYLCQYLKTHYSPSSEECTIPFLRSWDGKHENQAVLKLVACIMNPTSQISDIDIIFSDLSFAVDLGSYYNEPFFQSLVKIPGAGDDLRSKLLQSHSEYVCMMENIDSKIVHVYQKYLLKSDHCSVHLKLTRREAFLTNRSPKLYKAYISCKYSLKDFFNICLGSNLSSADREELLVAMFSRILNEAFLGVIQDLIQIYVEIKNEIFNGLIWLDEQNWSPIAHDVILGKKVLIFILTTLEGKFKEGAVQYLKEKFEKEDCSL